MGDNTAVSEGLGPKWENDLLAAHLEAKSTATDVLDISVAEEPEIATAPLEKPNMNTALHWINQLKLFALDRGMEDMTQGCHIIEDIITGALASFTYKTVQPSIENYFKK